MSCVKQKQIGTSTNSMKITWLRLKHGLKMLKKSSENAVKHHQTAAEMFYKQGWPRYRLSFLLTCYNFMYRYSSILVLVLNFIIIIIIIHISLLKTYAFLRPFNVSLTNISVTQTLLTNCQLNYLLVLLGSPSSVLLLAILLFVLIPQSLI